MATYSKNTTQKISGAVSATTGTNTTMYTVPANSYADITVFTVVTGGGPAGTITIGGTPYNYATFSGSSVSTGVAPIKAGPGQTVVTTGTSSVTWYISGVVYINTP